MTIVSLLLSLAQSAPPVIYEVSFPNAAHHEAEIRVTFSGLPRAPLEIWMSRSSPGRYALHEFAKNVYNLRATDGGGRALSGVAWLGDVAFTAAGGRLTLSSTALVGQPIYQAGLDRGDVITALDSMAVTTSFDVDSIVARHHSGDTISVAWQSRGVAITGRIVLEENPRMELVPGESAGAAITPGALEARRRWLASRAGIQGAPR